MKVELVSRSKDILKTVSTAARVCYSGRSVNELLENFSEEENSTLIRKVTSFGHLSVVEHGVFTFKVSKEFKEELLKIMMEKPFLSITEEDNFFIVSLNLRTMVELKETFPRFAFVKEISDFIPDWLF